ncbi:MAG: aminotransferase class III-fold pyridoxal phosphate-dependent enzyme [Thermomicrobiales bacterium]
MAATEQRAAHRLIPGAYWRQYHESDIDVVPVRGEGAKVYDASGREYIDYLLGSGPLILGHRHPAVTQALHEQIDRGTQFFFLTPEAMTLAEQLVAAVPCAESVRFGVSGAEAIASALRFARASTGREKILKFEGGFHGGHDFALMSSYPRTLAPWPEATADSAGIPAAIRDLVLIAPFNDLATTEAIIAAHGDEIAAVIVEPIQRFISPQPGFLQGLRDVTRRHGQLLIFDEIVTGFRLAYGGAQEHYEVTPDLAVLGKAFGGGLPLSAVVGAHDVLELCAPEREGRADHVQQLGTFNANPLSVAAALATLEQLRQPGVYERLYALGAAMRAGLTEILSGYSAPFRVFGEGPTFKVVFIDHDIVQYRDAKGADRELLRRFERAWVDGGLFITPGLRHYVSLAHSDADIARTLEIIDQAARETLPRA